MKKSRMFGSLIGVIAAGMVLVVGGCGWFDDPTPESVRVQVNGEPNKTVELIVSQAFAAGTREDGASVVTVFGSDTLVSVLPFDTVFTLLGSGSGSGRRRFFMQVGRVADSLSTVEVRAFLDNDLRYDQTGVLEDNFYRWAYAFNEPIGDIVEVL